jgi:hypothetical protein
MSMPFKVSKYSRAAAQVRALAKRAVTLGIFDQFRATVRRVQSRLENDPLSWGDPEYNTKHPGGVVHHGIDDNLLVRFAVYEAEQVVCIIEVEALPRSPLAEP